MLQTYVCVRLRCADCGRLLREAAEGLIPAHYPTHDAALGALRSVGGWVGRPGCITCPDCGPTRVQTGLCVGVCCHGCTQGLATPGGDPAHYPSEATARAAAQQAGWRTGQGGQFYCPVCTPVLTCRAHGHAFTPWRLLPLTTTEDPQDQIVVRRGVLVATPLVRAYRSCQRCGAHESHHDYLTSPLLVSGCRGQGKEAPAEWVVGAGVGGREVA
ncbi:MAG: hypothetical protein JO272_13600 [Pseudonocardiales bacterium]|nr:hypothetical protein [Pseudonocardiales bacterium]